MGFQITSYFLSSQVCIVSFFYMKCLSQLHLPSGTLNYTLKVSFPNELKNGILLRRTAGHVEILWNAHLSFKGKERTEMLGVVFVIGGENFFFIILLEIFM